MASKLRNLYAYIEELDSSVVAFSGGVDSSFLLKVASDVLGKRAVAFTARLASSPSEEIRNASATAKKIGVKHIVEDVYLPGEFWKNSPQRCFYCKKAICSRLWSVASREGMACVMDATNADDTGDFRPGVKALTRYKVISPLKETGITKKDIRKYSRQMHLDAWARPAMACLASRIPYGQRIDRRILAMVDLAECCLRRFIPGQVRVRVRDKDNCRVEVEPGFMALALKKRRQVVDSMRSAGFKYVSLDLEGYRTGSMNEVFGWTRKK